MSVLVSDFVWMPNGPAPYFLGQAPVHFCQFNSIQFNSIQFNSIQFSMATAFPNAHSTLAPPAGAKSPALTCWAVVIEHVGRMSAVLVALILGFGVAATASAQTFINKTTTDGLGNNIVYGVFASGSTVYAATNGGFSISTDGGASFTNKTTAHGLGNATVRGVFASGSTVYVATVGGLSISTDSGTSFANKTTADGLGDNIVSGVFASGSGVYAATNGGLSISTDGGASLTNKTTADGLGDNVVRGVFVSGSTVYAATFGGISISTDGGASFTNKTTAHGLGNNTVRGVFVSGSTVYAATNGGLSISTDSGTSFINKTTVDGLGNNIVYGVFASGSTVYAATNGGLSISTDGGASFTNKTTANGLGANSVLGLFASGTTVYAATGGGLSISNATPVASNVAITGSAQVGVQLTGSYSYTDTESDAQGASTFRWLRGATPIAGTTVTTYTPVVADVGSALKFCVTPVASAGTATGTEVCSNATANVAAAPANGACGTAANVATAYVPSANLCSVGTAGQVIAGTSSWSWSCSGTNGGNASPTCTAPFAATNGGGGAVGAIQAANTNNWQINTAVSGFVALPAPAPAGVSLPGGATKVVLNTGTPGTSTTVTLRFSNIPAGAQLYKYGKENGAGDTNKWFPFPATIDRAAGTVTYTLTDGQKGDNDWTVNGVIDDPVGLGVGAGGVEGVPTLSQWAMALMVGLMGFVAFCSAGRRKARV